MVPIETMFDLGGVGCCAIEARTALAEEFAPRLGFGLLTTSTGVELDFG